MLLGDSACSIFPDLETLPYDRLPPAGKQISQRLTTLNLLLNDWTGLVLATPSSLLQRLAPESWLGANCLQLSCGDVVSLERLQKRLLDAGYSQVSLVESPGSLAVRGAVLDFFPAGSSDPIRVEFFDDSIDTMRFFDPNNQMTTRPCESVRFFPSREFSLDPTSLQHFRHAFRTWFDIDETTNALFNQVTQGQMPKGAEYYLPMFFPTTALLPDYLKHSADQPHQGVTTFMLPGALAAVERFTAMLQERFDLLRHDPQHPLLPPDTIFTTIDALQGSDGQRPLIATCNLDELPNTAIWQPLSTATQQADSASWQHQCAAFINQNPQTRILFSGCSEGGIAAVKKNFSEQVQPLLAPKSDLAATISGLNQKLPQPANWRHFIESDEPVAEILCDILGSTGYQPQATASCDNLYAPATPVMVLGERNEYGQQGAGPNRIQNAMAAASDAEAPNPYTILAHLEPGQLIVHREQGIGRYQGLQHMEIDGRIQEFVTIEYRNHSLLHLPVSELGLINRYHLPEQEQPQLDQLGSGKFLAARKKAEQRAHDDAAELLALYAQQKSRAAPAMVISDELITTFCNQCQYNDTADQKRLTATIQQQLADPHSRPLLICGDVGFGKTELALRAAFIAIQAGYQCCILAPTTLLCQQHYQKCSQRFAGWPIQVAYLDSSLTGSQKKQLQRQLTEGSIDLLVSTHSVVKGKWDLPNLGLVVIDEEHRFGTSDKEKINTLQTSVHTISMTATPIPRTLNRSLSGLNEIALMHEPPPGRLPVHTFVRAWNDELVIEAMRRELMRGGQIFVVNDRIQGLDQLADQLADLVPEARIVVAHGRLPALQLRERMQLFSKGEADILLCTSIVESGLDIPNANTMLITRAERMGMAQLHQLRGRIGRSDKQAWCWLLYPPDHQLTALGLERLESVERHNELGAGFALARDDLELRGAGELLGKEQSGHMHRIGLDLYLSMLNRAIEDIKSGALPQGQGQIMQAECEIDLGDSAIIPDYWMPDAWMRVQYYHRLIQAETPDVVGHIQSELQDRFGHLPAETQKLLRNARFSIQARTFGISKVMTTDTELILEIVNQTLDPEAIVQLAAAQPKRIRLTPKSIRVILDQSGPETTLNQIFALIPEPVPSHESGQALPH